MNTTEPQCRPIIPHFPGVGLLISPELDDALGLTGMAGQLAAGAKAPLLPWGHTRSGHCAAFVRPRNGFAQLICW
jgi:hypothetical protein